MSKPPRARYRTTNWPAYNASLKRRGSLMVWLDPELQWQAAPSRRAGRPVVFSDAAIQFCLTLKCMFDLDLKQAIGLAESLLKLAQLDWNVPDYSTLSRRQKTLNVAITARPSQGWPASLSRHHRWLHIVRQACITTHAAPEVPWNAADMFQPI